MQLLSSFLTSGALFAKFTLSTGPYASLGDLFQGQLANLSATLPGNPALGGQDFGHCCVLAVNESLELDDGNVEFRPGQTFLHGNISTFLTYQFPCTASYNGSQGDQPQVTIPYSWCHSHCGGWAISQTAVTSDWVEPFIGYILPTIVFCFTIPRRRSVTIPRQLFPESQLLVFPENLTLLYKLPTAILLMLVDTLQWVITCVIMAGPMLLSGMLEVLLDSRILKYLSKNRQLSSRKKAHLLFLILIGNLDDDPAWRHSENLVSSLDDEDKSNTSNAPQDGNDLKQLQATSTTVDITPVPASLQFWQASESDPLGNWRGRRPARSQHYIDVTKSRLISVLESQAAFGTSVGIGVVFFVTSFFYSIGSIKSEYGDGGTSHSLAFGCFWMTIGHVAVVGGVLLAGDNPSALEAATTGEAKKDHPRTEPRHRSRSVSEHIRRWSESSMRKRRLRLPARFKDVIYRSGFSSRYRTAWMWNRGSTKAMWVARFSQKYPGLELQENVLKMGWLEMILGLALPSLLLFLIPAFLGGMTSYTTPSVGLSCRSMVPLLYSVAQIILVALWICDWKLWKRSQEGSVLTMTEAREIQNSHISTGELIWYSIFLFCVMLALVAAIGGTFFQTLGIFSNCLCWISIWQWSNRWSPDTILFLASDSSEQIYYAKTYWVPIGVSATVFLVITTYLGWQYQHRLRRKFIKLVGGIDSYEHNSENREDDSSAPGEKGQLRSFGTDVFNHRQSGIQVDANLSPDDSLTLKKASSL